VPCGGVAICWLFAKVVNKSNIKIIIFFIFEIVFIDYTNTDQPLLINIACKFVPDTDAKFSEKLTVLPVDTGKLFAHASVAI
jgi:hypothetical protein